MNLPAGVRAKVIPHKGLGTLLDEYLFEQYAKSYFSNERDKERQQKRLLYLAQHGD